MKLECCLRDGDCGKKELVCIVSIHYVYITRLHSGYRYKFKIKEIMNIIQGWNAGIHACMESVQRGVVVFT